MTTQDPNVDDGAKDGTENDNLSAEEQMVERLAWLRNEHTRLDQEISAITESGVMDMLKIQRMKKIKLSMKDQIVYLENKLTPDIIA